MPYSQFDLPAIQSKFGIVIREQKGLLGNLPARPISDFLQQALDRHAPLALAIDTEKARSELIIAPILCELKSQFPDRVGLFSGREFNVDPERGLTGFCDFLVSRSPRQLTIEAPVFALVEAKNDNIQSGLGQCVAEAIAAQIFNAARVTKWKQFTELSPRAACGNFLSWSIPPLRSI